MREVIGRLCVLSVFSGIAQSMCPEGSEKRALAFVCSVVLLAGVLSGVFGMDWQSYALETGQLRIREAEFEEQSEAVLRSLDRTVIEREYSTYILDMARRKGFSLSAVSVQAQWSLESLWIPYSAEMIASLEPGDQDLLAGWIEADLGIPRSRQKWSRNGG